MKTTPTLETRRLTLFPYTPLQVDNQQVRWLNDPAIVRYSDQRHKKHTYQTQWEYAKALEMDPKRHGWLITLNDVGIGTITATLGIGRAADLGILMGSSGDGTATEAWLAVMNWLLRDQEMLLVTCGCMKENIPMRLLAQRTGMVLFCRTPQYYYFECERIDPMLLKAMEKENGPIAGWGHQ